MRRRYVWLYFSAALIVTVAAGRWGKGLFTVSELVHFSINFPTEPGLETLPVQTVGGPWTRLPAEQWRGYPTGGLLVWGQEGELVVDIGQQGYLKQWLQPLSMGISTHWLRNVGTKPYRVRLAMDLCGMPMQWVTFETMWDQATHTTTRAIAPGTTFNMDWIVSLPETTAARPVVCEGTLRIYDAEENAL